MKSIQAIWKQKVDAYIDWPPYEARSEEETEGQRENALSLHHFSSKSEIMGWENMFWKVRCTANM